MVVHLGVVVVVNQVGSPVEVVAFELQPNLLSQAQMLVRFPVIQ